MASSADFPSISRMMPISLEEMSAVSLMNRTDTKFVTSTESLKKALEDAAEAGYRICEINGERLLSYSSIYYDTADLRMYTDHRNQKLTRQKVRTRTYNISGTSFLEIKRKSNHGRTKKKRISIPNEAMMDFSSAEGATDFLHSRSDWRINELSPETSTDFDRITLVNPGLSERITIDLNIGFENFRSGRKASLGEIAIIELKQDGRLESVFRRILTEHRILPFRISKYCTAVTLTDPYARPGRFKMKIRYIEKFLKYKLI